MESQQMQQKKKYLLIIGVVLVASFLIVLRILSWEWEVKETSDTFFKNQDLKTSLRQLWQETKMSIKKQSTESAVVDEKVVEELKKRIEEVNKDKVSH